MRKPWTDAEDAILRRRYASETAADIAKDLGRGLSGVYQRVYLLGLSKPEGWAAECTRKRWQEGRHENSRKAQFKPGVPSWSKGTKGRVGVQEACRATQFKKGSLSGRAAQNVRPIGAERISKDGYLERKIHNDLPLQSRWRAVHLVEWEAVNGSLPKGHALVFRNGDKTDIRLDNLELITRAELMGRNTYHRYPQPIPKLIQLRGALNRKINNKEKAA